MAKGQELEQRNRNFVQLDRGHLKHWRELIKTSPLAASIMMFLMEKATSTPNGNQAVVCSYAVIQEVTGYGRSSVANAIKILKTGNWISAVKIGGTYAYAVNERVAWRGAANGRQYAVFSATVIGTSTEQDAATLEDRTKLKRVPVLEPGDIASIGPGNLPPPDQLDMDVAGEIGDAHKQQSLLGGDDEGH